MKKKEKTGKAKTRFTLLVLMLIMANATGCGKLNTADTDITWSKKQGTTVTAIADATEEPTETAVPSPEATSEVENMASPVPEEQSTASPETASEKPKYSKVVTLGADLNAKQRKMILKFFGVTSDDDVIIEEITNKDERKYLDGIIDDSIIGTKTFSCAYILPMDEGGIIVKTANLNWVDSNMIKNALLTSGIENCQVLATAPFEVSGTGALTGVFKAYEKSTGMELDEAKKELANEEIATALELSDAFGDEGTELLNEAKANVLLSEKKEITEDDVREVIKKVAEARNIELTDEQLDKLTKLIYEMSIQDYSVDKLKGSLDSYATDILESKKGIIDAIISFFADLFKAIGDFFKGLFGGGSEAPQATATPAVTETVVQGDSIFDNLDDSEVKLDEPKTTEQPVATESAEQKNTPSVEATEQPVATAEHATEEPAVIETPAVAEQTGQTAVPESNGADLQDVLSQ